MALAQLSHRYVFGLKGDLRDTVSYLDEQSIVYPVGSNCVVYNVDQRSQKFIIGSEKSQYTSAIAVSTNRRYVAIAERGDKPTINIYDIHSLKRKKVLTLPECTSNEYVSMAFSPDSKYLVTQSGKPDWTLTYWTWEKSKPLACVKTTNQHNATIYQVTFNPQDNSQVCVTGSGIFKLFRYNEGNLKQFAFLKMDPQNYLSQSWLSDDKIIVGTDSGRLLLLEAGELKNEFSIVSPTAESRQRSTTNTIMEDKIIDDRLAIHSIVSYTKGFICGCANGSAYTFEKTDEKDTYRKTREMALPSSSLRKEETVKHSPSIKTITISPSEENLICSSSDNQLYTISLSSADMAKGEIISFELLSCSFHHHVISGLDICVRKPLVATCSMDRSVRIWNYETGSLELYKEFQEEAFSIALHPSGLYVLVGFSDKLRLMNLLIDDISSFKEFTIRGCRECSFSNGGHLFAAVHGNIVQLYSTSTFENVMNLKGHNGKVKAVRFNAEDSKIVSCGMDGAICEWSLITGKRESENVLKTCSYSDVVIASEGRTVYAVGSDRTLKEICDSQILREIQTGEAIFTQVVLSNSSRMLFGATNLGTIRSIKYPLTPSGDSQEYQAHSAAVTKVST
ncbi:uncharacterized protein TRIADDRAFT_27693 [Trichoplax adhaerens]|uniref:Anaphase-promoting complex subunit 4 WD40 domain-containing protein n=1 Tax=Trichoplax adhaerens TaxID=10228 RepID=B3S1R0_TRIAD|nr:hypothetical protein TRIADDRAFT_27693 [Trichoplax adhaerens]EDV23338.1 hypothetical protein TRIADDRAFT_27693 [Trichoplax adhaerens]|eukprot:XP_002114248.1 hypothetical protein TRIADDRAFT_27693 [Trichoplax adhaerens]